MKSVVSHNPIAYCDTHAATLIDRYESVSFEKVHGDLIPWLPKPPANVLDVGAGSGRDAYWFAEHGYHVRAVEPSSELRKRAQQVHQHQDIVWFDDALPDLPHIVALDSTYDFILLSAVLMFLGPSDQAKSLSTLANLLSPEGLIALTVRLGPSEPERGLHTLSEERLKRLIEEVGFSEVLSWNDSEDILGRNKVQWISTVLRRS